jgi:hypothetical protein
VIGHTSAWARDCAFAGSRLAYPLKSKQGCCPEDSLDPSTLAGGYKWGADAFRITEAYESLLSLTCHSTYWEPHSVAALRQVH